MDLNAPLGMEAPRPRRRWMPSLAVLALALLAAAGGGYMLVAADPHGGEPFAVVDLPPPRPSERATAAIDTTPTGSIAPAQMSSSSPVAAGRDELSENTTVENGVRVRRGTGSLAAPSSAQAPLVIDVSHQLDGGLKPRGDLTGSGKAASSAPAPPRIAIYVGAMGLNPSATQLAIDTMPPEVTFAFVANAPAAPASVDAARAKGHEIMLQLPMQNGQGQLTGPHALKPDETPAHLAGDLDWLMSRFSGYTGLTNLLGAPVTSNPATMSAVLKATGTRNLFFVDDGTSKRSLASSLAAQMNVTATQADLVLDATSDPTIVRANLDSLVAIARRKGQAIGMASGLPDHLATIARFAADLRAKNIALVPVGALAHRDTNVATNLR